MKIKLLSVLLLSSLLTLLAPEVRFSNCVFGQNCIPKYNFQNDVVHTWGTSTVLLNHTWSIKNSLNAQGAYCAATVVLMNPVVYKYTGAGSCPCTLPNTLSGFTHQPTVGAAGTFQSVTIPAAATRDIAMTNFSLSNNSAGVYVVLFSISKGGSPIPFNCTFWHNCRLYIYYITAPTNFTALPITPNSVALSWNPVPGVTGYELFRNNTSLGSPNPPNSTNFTATGLTPSTTYTFKVKAYINNCSNMPSSAPSSGFSGFSTVPAQTPACISPTIATNPTSQSVCNGSTVNLYAAFNGSIGGTFRWYKGTQLLTNPNGNSGTFTIPSANSGNVGSFKCIYTNCATQFPCTTATATVSINNATPTINVHPQSAVICNGASYTFSISATNATRYEWYRNNSLLPNSNSSSYVATLAGNYYCKAINCSNFATSTVVSLSFSNGATAPTNVNATDGFCGSVLVTWNPVQGATLYRVYRNGTQIGTSTSPSFPDAGAPTTQTPYTVRAVVCTILSPVSVADMGYQTAIPASCSAPSNLTATAIQTSASMSWSNVGAANYVVYYRAGNAGQYQNQTTTTNSITITGLSPNTAYQWYLVAQCNCNVVSNSSNIITTSTQAIPLSITANCAATATSGTSNVSTVTFEANVSGGNGNPLSVYVLFDDALAFPFSLTLQSPGLYRGSKVIKQIGLNRTFRIYAAQLGMPVASSTQCPGITVVPNPKDFNGYHSSKAGDPFVVTTRAFTHGANDLFSSGVLGRTDFTRNFNSVRTTRIGGFGPGWFSMLDVNLDTTDRELWKITYADGSQSMHGVYNGYVTRNAVVGQRDTLIKNPNATYSLIANDGNRLLFNANGTISKMIDRNNNQIVFAYNGLRCSSITLPGGRSFQITWNTSTNRVTQVTNGFTTVAYAYNSSNELTSATWSGDGTVSTMQYTYIGNHFIETIRDARGNVYLTNGYNPDGTIATQLDYFSTPTTITYNAGITTVDQNGHVTKFYQDANQREVKTEDGLTFSNLITYGPDNLVTRFRDQSGIPVSITYNSHGYWTELKDSTNAKTKRRLGVFDLTDVIKNAVGDSTVFQRDAFGNAYLITLPDGLSTIQTIFLANGLPKQVIDQLGHPTHYGYSSHGDLDTITTALGYKYVLHHNMVGLPDTLQDPTGKIWSFTFNKFGQVRFAYYPDGMHREYQYDLNGNLVGTRDKEGNWTTYEYDQKDRLTKINYPNGFGSVTMGYDAWDNMIWVRDQYNHKVFAAAYNARNEMVMDSTVLGAQTHTYKPNGLPESSTDRFGNTYTSYHDVQNQLVGVANAGIGVATQEHDAIGRVTETKDPKNRATTYSYDWKGIKKVRDAIGGENEFLSNALGQMITASDANNHDRTTRFDADGRAVCRHFPGGDSITITYNAVNMPITITDRMGVVLTIVYDNVYNITELHYSTGMSKYFRYSPNGWLMAARLGADSVVVTRNALGWVETKTENGKTIIYERNLLGLITKMLYPSGMIVEYRYNSKYLIDNIKVDNVSLADYFYTSTSLLDSVRFRNGATQRSTYNMYGALVGRVNRRPDGTVIHGQQVILDSLLQPIENIDHRRINLTMNGVQRQFAYNPDDGPISDGTNTFTNTKEGQQLQVDGNTYTWNPDGTCATLAAPGVNATFLRNAFGQFTGMTMNGTSSNFVNDNEFMGMATRLETYDGSNNLLDAYVLGPNGIACRDSAGILSFFHSDCYNGIVALTDSIGQVTDLYVTDPWGDNMNHEGPSSQPFIWRGAEGVPHIASGIFENRARLYTASLHRFINPDPLGEDWSGTQSVQAFRYGFNNPFSNSDPTGLRENMLVVAIKDQESGYFFVSIESYEDFVGLVKQGYELIDAGEAFQIMKGEVTRARKFIAKDFLKYGVLASNVRFAKRISGFIPGPVDFAFAAADTDLGYELYQGAEDLNNIGNRILTDPEYRKFLADDWNSDMEKLRNASWDQYYQAAKASVPIVAKQAVQEAKKYGNFAVQTIQNVADPYISVYKWLFY